MSLYMSFEGLDDLLNKLDQVPQDVAKQVKPLFQKAQEATYTGSQADVPVDRGDQSLW